MTPMISVALCTYNGGRFVEEQLTSILDQTRRPDEIVVSDDGSVDNTVAVVRATLDRWMGEHPEAGVVSVVLADQPQRGVAGNFERALAATTGSLIALSDQDDVWPPDRLQRLAGVFGRDDVLLVHTDARMVDSAGVPMGAGLLETLGITANERRMIESGDAFDALMHRNLVTGATVMLRRELFERAAPFPDDWLHDEWLAVVAAASGRLVLVPEQLVDYRQHATNQIGARALSLAGKVRRIQEPRTEKNNYLARRAANMVTRLTALGSQIPDSRLAAARGKLAHERFRAGLHRRRMLRIVPVLAHAVRRDYARFGRGGADIVRDLIQPA
jgi:glycosyltransferase involved in cell wall biosynthesis